MTTLWYALIDQTGAPYRTASVTSVELKTGKENVTWLTKTVKSQFKNLLAIVPSDCLYVFKDPDVDVGNRALSNRHQIANLGKDPRNPLIVLAPHPAPDDHREPWTKTNRTFNLPRTESGQPYVEINPALYNPETVRSVQEMAIAAKLVKKPSDLLVRPTNRVI